MILSQARQQRHVQQPVDGGGLQALQARHAEVKGGAPLDPGADPGPDARRGHDAPPGGAVLLAQLQQPLL